MWLIKQTGPLSFILPFRMVEQLEYGITQYMWGTARLVHSVLPSRCFRIRESTQHHIKFNFDPTKIPFSPSKLYRVLTMC